MRPVSRSRVNKRRSVGNFRKSVGRTRAVNMVMAPMRGGWRL